MKIIKKNLLIILCCMTINSHAYSLITFDTITKIYKATKSDDYGFTAFKIVSTLCASYYASKQLTLLIKNYLISSSSNYVIKGHSPTDLRCAPLNNMSRIYFNQCNAHDFETMCNNTLPDNIPREELSTIRRNILQQYNMYQFAGFRTFIEKMPEFENHIFEAAEKLKTDKNFYKIIYHMQGFKKGELGMYITTKAMLSQKKVELFTSQA